MKYIHIQTQKEKANYIIEQCKKAGKKYKVSPIAIGEKTYEKDGKTYTEPVFDEKEVMLRVQVKEYEVLAGVELEENTSKYYTQKTIRRLLKSTNSVILNNEGVEVESSEVLLEMKSVKDNPQILPTLKRDNKNSFTLYIDYIIPFDISNGCIDEKSARMSKKQFKIVMVEEVKNVVRG